MSLPKGVAQTISFAMCDRTLEYVSGLTLVVTVQKDGAAPVAATNAATEIGTTGRYDLALTAAERNADEVVVAATDGYITTLVTDYPGPDVLTPLAVVDSVADAVKAKTDNLPASPAAVGSNMGTVASVTGAVGSVASFGTLVADIASAVWAAATRTLSAFGFTPNAGNMVAAAPSAADNAAAVWGAATKAVTAVPDVQLAASQDHITPYSGTPPTVAQIEAALINEGDATALLQAIADKIAGDFTVGDVSSAAIAAAVRANLTTELAHIVDIHATDLPAVKADTAAILGDTVTDGVKVSATSIAAVVDALLDEAVSGHQEAESVGSALATSICKWVESEDGTTITLYKADGVSVLGTFPWTEATRTRGRLS